MQTRLYQKMKVLQAPMCSTTDLPFRKLARKMGLKFAFTEMITARPFLLNCEKTYEYLKTDESDRPLGTQVIGRDPDEMADAFQKLEAMDLFDVIDINMGCPVKKVVAKGVGSALMKEPKQFERMLRKAVKATKTPVTVKFRTGWDESSINAVEIAKIAEDCGAQAVTVHGRTRSQMYSGEIDFDTIRQVKENVSIPVIGNGGIFSKEDADEMFKKTGCDLVMVSRGSNGNPWIFQNIEENRSEEQAKDIHQVKAILLEHASLMADFYAPEKLKFLLRRIGSYYFSHFEDKDLFKKEAIKVNNLEEFQTAVENYTQSHLKASHPKT